VHLAGAACTAEEQVGVLVMPHYCAVTDTLRHVQPAAYLAISSNPLVASKLLLAVAVLTQQLKQEGNRREQQVQWKVAAAVKVGALCNSYTKGPFP
jgi:hypothetical protein